MIQNPLKSLLLATSLLLVAACNGTSAPEAPTVTQAAQAGDVQAHDFNADREAILAMVGDYKVTFDFTETVAFQEGYELKEPYITGGYEIVRVVEDTGTMISLQHILVVGDGEKMPEMAIKHWRQDWIYEPADVMDFVGANTWQKRKLSAEERAGKWAQIVYQVDDAPRYAAVAAWDHKHGISAWTSPPSWRPLPRRDATKRDDYHVVVATNRHAITPDGWVHEQDNAKLRLTGEKPQVLANEIGVNTYTHFDGFKVEIGTDYWEKTQDFWRLVRLEWENQFEANDTVGLTLLGEPSEMYMEILGIASEVASGEASADKAGADAVAVIRSYVTTDPAPAAKRLQAAEKTAEKSEAYSR